VPGSGFRAGPALTGPRDGHTATRLDGDRVLMAGGYAGEGMGGLRAVEICDLARCRPTGEMAGPRGAHGATRLRGGDVLVAGGFDRGRALRRSERFAGGRFRAVARWRVRARRTARRCCATAASSSAAAPARTGRALATAELYDPASDRWSPAGRLGEGRTKHAAVRLPDGRVLLVGGARDRESRGRLASTELYDPPRGASHPARACAPGATSSRTRWSRSPTAACSSRATRRRSRSSIRPAAASRSPAATSAPPARSPRPPASAPTCSSSAERIAIQAGAYLVG